MLNDVTLIQVIDDNHIKELKYSWETWKELKPEITKLPLYLVYDSDMETSLDTIDHIIDRPNVILHKFDNKKYYVNQRSAMLTSFFEGVRNIKTKYYLKLDTDCVATDNSKEWIRELYDRDKFCFISKGWSLSRKTYIEMLETWLNETGLFGDYSLLDGFVQKGAYKLKMKRIISWFFLCNVEWNNMMSEYCWKGDHYELPCPSQDTYLWYMAELTKTKYKRVDFKKLGFHHRKLRL